MCESGICWNVSAVYMCEFRDVLQVEILIINFLFFFATDALKKAKVLVPSKY
jgi:hypothetical protein